jgi:hypothetical protein
MVNWLNYLTKMKMGISLVKKGVFVSMETQQFFDDIFNGKHINFRCLRKGGDPISLNGLYNDYIKNQLDQLNQQNYDVYFVVNSGGYKDNQINEINAAFIDLDCGRDENGEYFPLEVTRQFKQQKLDQLQKYRCKPGYIIETRNGLQCYWLLNKMATIDQFKECEKRLIAYFDADKTVKNPSNLMRVPDYYWVKDIQNRFLAAIIEHNDVRYDIEEIIDSLVAVCKEDTGDYNNNINTLDIVTTYIPLDSHTDYL